VPLGDLVRAAAARTPDKAALVLYQHPVVGVACMVGVLDRRLGEIVRGYAALRHDAAPAPSAAKLKAFVAHHIASHKVPERIEIRSELPLNPVKVDRHALQARALAELTGRSGS
jgi:acyl-CoA synthetase (AMP-forming)/AMP-acid ligase II